MSRVLLDTCALIFLTEKVDLRPAAIALLTTASEKGVTFISPVSAWEVGMLVARGKLQFTRKPERWFANLFKAKGVVLSEMPPELLIASSFLHGQPPRDPFDRMIAATARELGATLVTRDRALLAYGEQGHIAAVEC